MSDASRRRAWFYVLMGMPLIAGTHFAIAGVQLAHSMVGCWRSGKAVCWQCDVRAGVLLFFLPAVLLGFRYPKLTAYALFGLSVVAAVMALTEMDFGVKLES